MGSVYLAGSLVTGQYNLSGGEMGLERCKHEGIVR